LTLRKLVTFYSVNAVLTLYEADVTHTHTHTHTNAYVSLKWEKGVGNVLRQKTLSFFSRQLMEEVYNVNLIRLYCTPGTEYSNCQQVGYIM